MQHLTQAKLPDNDDHIKMKNMIKRKISVLNKLTQSEIDDCSEIIPTRSDNMLNSAAIGVTFDIFVEEWTISFSFQKFKKYFMIFLKLSLF